MEGRRRRAKREGWPKYTGVQQVMITMMPHIASAQTLILRNVYLPTPKSRRDAAVHRRSSIHPSIYLCAAVAASPKRSRPIPKTYTLHPALRYDAMDAPPMGGG